MAGTSSGEYVALMHVQKTTVAAVTALLKLFLNELANCERPNANLGPLYGANNGVKLTDTLAPVEHTSTNSMIDECVIVASGQMTGGLAIIEKQKTGKQRWSFWQNYHHDSHTFEATTRLGWRSCGGRG